MRKQHAGAALTLALAIGVGVPAGSAEASASGCVWAPGSLGANQCLGVYGSSTWVNGERESYTYGGFGWNNVCNYQAYWQYKRANGYWYTTWSSYINGCSLQAAYIDGPVWGDMWDNSYFYGAWKSDTTNNNWTDRAAIVIRR